MKILFSILLFTSIQFATKIELEILGSGGPELDGRASTSYILFIDDKAKLLIDMGSGSMLRFEQSGAKLEDLDAVVLTHLHIDHAVDLPSYVKAGYFSPRTEALEIFGPFGNKYFPSIDEYIQNLFGENGAYRYMQDILSQDSDSFQIIPRQVKENKMLIKKYNSFTLTLISVHHGIVPAIALRIDVDNKNIVISGDTNNQNNAFQKISKNADLFIVHHAITSHANSFAKSLHVEPTEIAKVAVESNIKKIILTHRMKRTIGFEKETLDVIKNVFNGEVLFGEDKMVLKL